jgi:threonine aldolase
MIDLRSDTITRPTAGMRKAMADADVGDDAIDIDPTVERLQCRIAEVLGKEAAIFMPSGTMTNQVAVRIHCKPGDELICEANCHIYNYEQGGFAQLSGAVARPVLGHFGVLRCEQLQGLIRPENEHFTRTRLICLENTHNRGGGRIQPYDEIEGMTRWAREHGLRAHLDGARLFNAAIASGVSADRWAQHFDTVSVCFSKGLGAPVGSALAGSREVIREARRHRKLFGGGMRQAGIIAAGALYALEHHIERLAIDHENAQILAEAIRQIEGLTLEPDTIDTNIVIFRVDPQLGTGAELVTAWKERGVSALAIGGQVRAVTHLDVNTSEVRRAAEILRDTTSALRRGVRPVQQGDAY